MVGVVVGVGVVIARSSGAPILSVLRLLACWEGGRKGSKEGVPGRAQNILRSSEDVGPIARLTRPIARPATHPRVERQSVDRSRFSTCWPYVWAMDNESARAYRPVPTGLLSPGRDRGGFIPTLARPFSTMFGAPILLRTVDETISDSSFRYELLWY